MTDAFTMKILALEFSTSQRSVAAGEIGGSGLVEVIETGGRATHAVGMIDRALREARLTREQVECLVVGLGPGSYTGIRAAIAVAQGWQLARPTRLLGVSSAECVAAQARAEGITGAITVVIDAQRREFYLADYDLTPERLRPAAPLRLATLSQAQACRDAGRLPVGPDPAPGFPLHQVVFPRAARLVQLAAGRTDFVAGDRLEPLYLRETQFVKAAPARPGAGAAAGVF